ncbi:MULTISPECIES: sugar phosphate isomerase/epimerase family protein [Tenacibaculum]|uniref:sugar phosphate isomerase/epimerase family protein n=1 Tax=Tenacibaculum TaxID=104267 RepID=UPI001F0A7584|nr:MULTISPECIES: TIM barrel protein [Tenacibaculum]MCH3882159.1 sugar phosphate isomerase/epimerase [Tenacibaculum aquimarinum]MDO6599800.1 TIM barrel protein [Tenacibaculum sp. 1_MG-2023]
MSIKSENFSRREFAKLTGLALATIPFMSFVNNPLVKTALEPDGDLKVYLFSKHLQFLNYNDMSAAAANMGFNGLDLTVRRKGHVLPENVLEDLPKAVDAMKKYGLAPKMMSTNVWDVKDKVQKKVLETASKLGFSHYRTDWLKYPEDVSISESQALFGKQAKELEILNKKLGLIGGYQNHAGKHVGAPIWDLLPILEATDGKNMGSQYDIRHAVIEGGESWELGLRKIKPYINSIVLKDVKWEKKDGKWQPINVPIGEGMVDFNRYFSLLKKYKINVPVSLHVEHNLGGAEKGRTKITIPEKEVYRRIKKDLLFLKEAWKNA